jgi:5-methylcytosine-specific restriction endonuclease McrA
MNGDGRDDRRGFSTSERAALWARAGMRCELCRRPTPVLSDGEADHWWPHSRGGVTHLDNGVWLDVRCNRRKSDRKPSLVETLAVNRHRRAVGAPELHKENNQ